MTTPEAEAVEVQGCPFCGEPPFIGPLNPEDEGGAWTEIVCNNGRCDPVAQVEAYGEGHRARAIAAWNTRTPPKEADRE